MRQITSGETPKIKIYDRSHIEDFIQTIKQDFEKVFDKKDCIYENTLKVIDNPVLNFLNTFDSKFKGEQVKSLIKKEFDDCESIYPFLGDLFVMKFFDVKCINNKNYLLQKTNTANFLDTIKNNQIKEIFTNIFKQYSLQRTINIVSTQVSNIKVEKIDSVKFKLQYDHHFLGNKQKIEFKNYKFIIVDGFIESVGEIHHLLHFAAKNKEPHVIFCYGLSEEVKNVIMQNNARGVTQIVPISMQMSEDNINIMNDLAVIHDADVVSATKGQTISQESRKDLPYGNEVVIRKDSLVFKPVCDEARIRRHLDFLEKRIEEANVETNVDIIKNRIKNLTAKSINVYVPEQLLKSHEFVRELDYAIRFLSNCEKNMSIFKLSETKKVLIPNIMIDYVDKKINSLRNVFYNIEKLMLFEEA